MQILAPQPRADLAAHVPEFAARLATEPSLARPAVLPGALGRAPRWWRPGFLLLGDAAHTMSPIGGVGILMAVADAAAAANVLVPAFDRGTVTPADLAAVQGRRARPVALVQGLQATIGCRMSRPGLLTAGVAPASRRRRARKNWPLPRRQRRACAGRGGRWRAASPSGCCRPGSTRRCGSASPVRITYPICLALSSVECQS